MRFLAQPVDDGATGSYRSKWPAEAAIAQGADVVWSPQGIVCKWSKEWTGTQPPRDVELIGLDRKPEADVVIWQRPARRWLADLIPHLHKAGVGVVVDVDDRLDKIPRDNIAFEGLSPKKLAFGINANEHRNWQWVERACRLADVVTASTPELAERFGFGHGHVIPNYTRRWYLDHEPEERRDAIGWTGWIRTHPKDLHVVGDAVARALPTDWSFHTVGGGEGVAEALGLDPERVTTTGGWVALDEYPMRMAEIGVGIVPLQDNPFNRAKSFLKMSEFAALGIPVVASPTPDNVRLHAKGVGLLANSPGQWRKKLQSLVKNEGLRKDVAGQGREVMGSLTIEGNVDRYLAVWSKAARCQKS